MKWLAFFLMTSVGHSSIISVGPGTVNVGANGIQGILSPVHGGSAPVTRTMYVDVNRTDTYTADGSYARPFKDPNDAIAQVNTNGDSSGGFYRVQMLSGTYGAIHITGSTLSQMVLDCGGSPYVSSIDSTSANDNLKGLFITNCPYISGSVTLIGASNNTQFLSSFGEMDNVGIVGDLTCKNAGVCQLQSVGSAVSGTYTVENVLFAEMNGGSGMQGGSVCNVITDGTHNVPTGWGGQTISIWTKTLAACDMTCDAGSLCQVREGTRVGSPGGALNANGTFQAYSSYIRSNITVGSAGSFALRGSFYGGSLSVTAGGVFSNFNPANEIAYSAATPSNWSPVPTDTNSARDQLAALARPSGYMPFSTGSLTSIVANEIVGSGKTTRAQTIDNLIGSATLFTCVGNPTLTLLDCGTSAGACTSGTTTLGTVTLTAANTTTTGSVSTPSIAAGHYWAWEITSGTCASLTASGTAEFGMQ